MEKNKRIKFNIKNIGKINNCIFACILICILFLFSSCTFRPTINNSFSREDMTITASRSDFKILQLSDIQVKSAFSSYSAMKVLKKYIARVAPDMLVLTGDTFGMSCTMSTVRNVIEGLESTGLPYAIVYGNHDDEGIYSKSQLSDIFSNAVNSMFVVGEDLTGEGNYCYNVEFENDKKFSLFFLDSNSYRIYEEVSPFTTRYDYIYEDQIDWFTHTASEIANTEGETVPSFAFFHIPTPEFVTAYDLYLDGEITGSGDNRENISSPYVNTGFFDAAKQAGTKAIFVGHDHTNNSILDYQDVKLCFGLKSSMYSYYDVDRLGGVMITIYDDQTFDIEREYFNSKEISEMLTYKYGSINSKFHNQLINISR